MQIKIYRGFWTVNHSSISANQNVTIIIPHEKQTKTGTNNSNKTKQTNKQNVAMRFPHKLKHGNGAKHFLILNKTGEGGGGNAASTLTANVMSFNETGANFAIT